jgi:peptidoglycan/xylan/chitin deacetylase (PgdA/CDA1 family)
MLQQAPSTVRSGTTAAAFAQSRGDTGDVSLLATVSAKASRFLARNVRFKTVPVGHNEPLVTFTFDDVPVSACRIAGRILERHGARGTYFVCGGGCGMMSPGGRLASADEIGALWDKGHEIGCHTYSHIAISSGSAMQIAADLDRNRSFLKAIDKGIVVSNFAYPYGDFSLRTKRHLQHHFDSCRSLLRGVNTVAADLGVLKSWPLEDATLDHGKIVAVIDETVRTKGWLIFSSHDVDERPSAFGVTPELFTFAVAAAKRAGCTIVTVAEALERLRGKTVISSGGTS